MNLVAGTFTDELVSNDVAVWIDPINISKALDNEDDLKNLTNMIGITVNGRPRVGIIHKPFASKQKNRTYVGSTESVLFFFDQSLKDQTTSTPTYVSPFQANSESSTTNSSKLF